MSLGDQLNQLLPQTQCTLCDYQGCRPYAQAMAEGTADIDRCAPGGIPTLEALAKILKKNPDPYRATVEARYKPPSKVLIDTKACIGCTKCIPSCPVGAIAGAPKHLHQVIDHQCTGCDLCISTCPVNCIHPTETMAVGDQTIQAQRAYWQDLYEKTEKIKAKRLDEKKSRYEYAKAQRQALLDRIKKESL
jgi:electron transport complex protein RnfB